MSRWTKESDSPILKKLVSGCEEAKDPYWRIHENLIELLRAVGLAQYKWRFFSGISLAYVSGHRDFAVENLLGTITNMLKELPGNKKDGESNDR